MGSDAVVIASRYELGAKIAHGSYGVVVEAHDRERDCLVAIKLPNPSCTDLAAHARFLREARAAASVDHPNVCAVLDTGLLADGRPFLVMERLVGETLSSHLARSGELDAEDAIELALQLLSGLEAVHAQGIVHRDIKPSNVFMSPRPGLRPLVVLLDFGMCRRACVTGLDELTLTFSGGVVGTPEYMAPEQAWGIRAFDPRVDLFPVGLILQEALTGERAFGGGRGSISGVRARRPELPIALARVLARALERDPRERFSTAREFQHELLEARTALRRHRRVAVARSGRVAPPFDWDAPTRVSRTVARARM